MDRNVLESRLREHFEKRLPAMIDAVEKAPDGQWIAASEWLVREEFQALAAECFGSAVQGRLEALPSEKQAAFSPGGKPGHRASQQGRACSAGADGRG
jgi:hypothetical protein